MSRQMFNEDFYKLRRDFNPNVVPSVDFVPNTDPDDPDMYNIKTNEPYPDPFGVELPLAKGDMKGMDFLNGFMNDKKLAAGYSPLIPEGLRDKYKREADIDKYLKNIERLRKRGLV